MLGKMRRPMLGHDLEELDRVLPVNGVLLRRELFESGEVDLFAFDEVHEVAEVGGKIRGLRRCRDRRHGLVWRRLAALVQRLAPGKHEPHQGKAPLQRTDTAGTAGAGKALLCIAFAAENDRGILVRIAERPDRGQQHGTPSGSFEKSIAECSDGAAGGQVDDGAGQLERIRLGAARHRQVAVEHSACER